MALETVLAQLQSRGLNPPAPCRNGVCHLCRHQTPQSGYLLYQGSLNPALQALGYYLPCRTPAQLGLRALPPDPGEEAMLSLIELPGTSAIAALWQILQKQALLAELVTDLGNGDHAVSINPLLAGHEYLLCGNPGLDLHEVCRGQDYVKSLQGKAWRDWLHRGVQFLRIRKLPHAQILTWLSCEICLHRQTDSRQAFTLCGSPC